MKRMSGGGGGGAGGQIFNIGKSKAKVFDENAARVMGLNEGDLALQIHCGSRGLGHQVCSDYVKSLQSAVINYGIELPDRELVCAPMNSPE